MKFKCEVVEKHVFRFDMEARDEEDAMEQLNDGWYDDYNALNVNIVSIELTELGSK
jgi:hypothetical protein